MASRATLDRWTARGDADRRPPRGGRPGSRPAAGAPVFRGGVDRVAVATVVRTKAGKAVTDLKADDFELIDSGQPRKIDEFRAEASPVSLALLVDFSGSMDVAEKRMTSKAMAGHILSWLTADTDQIGLYAFDKTLHELAPLAPAPGDILDQFERDAAVRRDVALRRDRRNQPRARRAGRPAPRGRRAHRRRRQREQAHGRGGLRPRQQDRRARSTSS